VKITEILEKRKPIFSCEFFPPKTEEGTVQLYETVRELKELGPGYVSVTYGAGGSTRGKTIEIVQKIKNELKIEAMAHLTCVGHSREELKDILDQIERAGIDNVIALRGDPPKGELEFKPHPDGFKNAIELVEFIKKNYNFRAAVAGYPEGHVETPDKKTDWDRLHQKVQAGADFMITQLFFNNVDFMVFEKDMRARGISIPIIPGIMPITNFSQIVRFTKMCGAKIPEKMTQDLSKIEQDPEAVQNYGARSAITQCAELLKGGAPGIHFYTLNKSKSTRTIIESLKKTVLVFAACTLLLFPAIGNTSQESSNKIFSAMERELNRSVKKLKIDDFGAPYYVFYSLLDTKEHNLVARFGTLLRNQKSQSRYVYVRVRYGDHGFDSSLENDQGFSDSVSIEDSPEDIQHRLWILTDRAYKGAIKNYLKKQGKKISEMEKENLNDFSKESPIQSIKKPEGPPPDLDRYSETLRSASGYFKKFDHIQDGNISMRAKQTWRLFSNLGLRE